jgi:hypothetical protein
MPVAKSRSVEELPPPTRGDAGDPTYVAIVRALWARTMLLTPPCARPGVHRFRSISEAQHAREALEHERTQRLRAR